MSHARQNEVKKLNKQFNNTDIDTIMHTALFKGVPESVLNRVLSVSGYEYKLYKKDEPVYSRTSFSRSIGVLLEGRLYVTKENADGKRIVMSTLNKGNIFGAAALFNSEQEFATDICAAEDCRIVFFSQAIIKRLIERESKIAENYIVYLSERILFLNKKIYFLTSGTAEQRLSSHLMNNLSEFDFLPLPMPMVKTAEALNISRASLYRALDAIVDSGAVEKKGKLMRIADIERLCDFIV